MGPAEAVAGRTAEAGYFVGNSLAEEVGSTENQKPCQMHENIIIYLFIIILDSQIYSINTN